MVMWENEKVRRWEGEKMKRWVNDKMRRCEKEKLTVSSVKVYHCIVFDFSSSANFMINNN